MPQPTGKQSAIGPLPIDLILKVVALSVIVCWSLLLIEPFLTVIVWSGILAVVVFPLFDWMVSRLHLNRIVAAVAITTLSLLVMLGPATWLAVSSIGNVRIIYAELASGALAVPPPSEAIKTWPLIGPGLYDFWNLAAGNLKAAVVELSPQLKPLGSGVLTMVGSAGVNTLQFFAAVVLSGFLLAPGRGLAASIKAFAQRISSHRGAEFVELAGATIRNLARGVIGLSLLQSLLAGVGFLIAGVPAAGLLSFLVLLLGILQVGAAIVLVLPVVWAWFTKDTSAALIFTAYMVPVGLVDNVLRPLVLAHGLKTPMPVILIGVIGGILAHGLIGLFIGPIVLAIAWELLLAWMREETAEAQAASLGGPDRSGSAVAVSENSAA